MQTCLLEYLQAYDFLSVDQSAYVPGRSMVTSLHKVTDEWLEAIENGEVVASCFVDISKCFDTLCHSTLLFKLSKYGVYGTTLNWFKSYLENRMHTTACNGQLSPFTVVNVGVPQGSVLGPLLFLLYMNDLTSHTSSRCNMFADDTLLYCSNANFQE